VINTGTTIITCLMVFLIQNTQNRDTAALQLKLDELILATKAARNSVAGIEDALLLRNADDGERRLVVPGKRLGKHLHICRISPPSRTVTASSSTSLGRGPALRRENFDDLAPHVASDLAQLALLIGGGLVKGRDTKVENSALHWMPLVLGRKRVARRNRVTGLTPRPKRTTPGLIAYECPSFAYVTSVLVRPEDRKSRP
jgi:low affinity iron permease